jgi:hypothetical protein
LRSAHGSVVEQVDARGNVYSMVIDYDSFLEQEGVNPEGVTLRRTWLLDYDLLEQKGVNLEGATLHDGQKYEDWLKDKEGR